MLWLAGKGPFIHHDESKMTNETLQQFASIPVSLTREQVTNLIEAWLADAQSPWRDYNPPREYATSHQAASLLAGYPGGKLTLWVLDKDGKGKSVKATVTAADITKGLTILANKYPECFAKIITSEYGMVTVDYFGQCVVYGEVLYG